MIDTCHKMKLYITNPDGTELWCCPHSECAIQWLIKPNEIGPPEFISRDGHSEDFCHSFGYEVQPDDLVLSVGIGDE